MKHITLTLRYLIHLHFLEVGRIIRSFDANAVACFQIGILRGIALKVERRYGNVKRFVLIENDGNYREVRRPIADKICGSISRHCSDE